MRTLSCGVAFGLALTLSAAKAEPATHDALIQALRTQRMDIALVDGRLSGPGAQWLQRETPSAQFVLVGEEHATAEIPQFAAALWRDLAAQGVQHLVLEAGPWSLRTLEQEAQHGDEGIAKLNRSYPMELPFFAWREDGALALAAVQSSGRPPALWGIDQEFLLSLPLHFDHLAAAAPDKAARALAQSHREKAVAAYAEMAIKHDFNANYMARMTASDFAALRQAFAKAPADARDLIDALEQSAQVYRDQNDKPYDSNLARSQMMKRYFMAHYRAAQKKEPQPRAMFRLGAFHSIRGLGPRNLLDIGNLASELAASNGSRSLHILVVPAGGEINRWFPFVDDEAARHTPYDAKQELGEVGALPLLEASTTGESWSLFPTEWLRTQRALRQAGGADFERAVFGYDAVVVIPRVHEATFYGD